MDSPALIGLDWGTTRLRAYLLGSRGEVLFERASTEGILSVPQGRFAPVLASTVGDWLAKTPSLPVIAAGMVGSRAGWHEVPYVPISAGLRQIAAGTVPVKFESTHVWLVPGVSQRSGETIGADVVRGEETQVLGALGPHDDASRLWVLPGTHSKWITTEAHEITRIGTFFTGELFAALSTQGTLAQVMLDEGDEVADERGFHRGLEASRTPGLLGRLFSVRAEVLLDEQPTEEARGYLSGLLIGAEVLEAHSALESTDEVGLIADATLGKRYRQALQSRGFTVSTCIGGAAAQGLFSIGSACGLVP